MPSKSADRFLFAAKSAGTESTTSYGLSGAGIDHLAGGWEEDPNRGSDVATHPITDRSEPVTLIENPQALTVADLLQRGDETLSRIVDRQTQSFKDAQDATQDPNSRPYEIQRAQEDYAIDSEAVNKYVQAYNERTIPGYSQIVRQDSVNRARILRRYRLYSDQPDEMITLRALAQMHPVQMDFDPRLYQYGGLWIYPVAGLIKFAGMINLATVTADRGFYLDHPEEFGRFYVVMRAYSAVWGVIGVLTVFALMRRLCGGVILPVAAALCFILMPVVLSLAHEAKPHLAGGVLLMLAVLAGSKYVETGKTKWMLWLGIACGAAAGMVLSAAVGFILIPLAALLRRNGGGRALGGCLLAMSTAVIVYCLSNPYVAIHLANPDQHQVLRSNLGNSKAMYHVGPIGESLVNAAKLLAAGASTPIALLSIVGLLIRAVTIRKPKPSDVESDGKTGVTHGNGIGWMLTAIAAAVLFQFVLYAAGKSAEYARFALIPDIALMLLCVAAIGRVSRSASVQSVFAIALVAGTALFGFGYLKAFVVDAGDNSSRLQAAGVLHEKMGSVSATTRPVLGVYAEPAPYCLPPVDLFEWKIVLLPSDTASSNQLPVDLSVEPIESVRPFDPFTAPITWAGKSFRMTGIGRK